MMKFIIGSLLYLFFVFLGLPAVLGQKQSIPNSKLSNRSFGTNNSVNFGEHKDHYDTKQHNSYHYSKLKEKSYSGVRPDEKSKNKENLTFKYNSEFENKGFDNENSGSDFKTNDFNNNKSGSVNNLRHSAEKKKHKHRKLIIKNEDQLLPKSKRRLDVEENKDENKSLLFPKQMESKQLKLEEHK